MEKQITQIFDNTNELKEKQIKGESPLQQWRIESFFGHTGYILKFPLPLCATMVGRNF